MAALKPEIIKDAYHLIALYQRNPTFRERFDLAIDRSVNVTYKHRPLRLYFEVLASSNKAKFGESYKDISRLVRHDTEGIIKKTLLRVNTRDFVDLNLHARNAEKNINTTTYTEEEIEKINKIEETSKTLDQKQKDHKERLETTNYLNPAKKTAEVKKDEKIEEKPIPGSSHEHKKSYNPASQEEKARLLTALKQPKREVPKNILIGINGKPIKSTHQETHTTQATESRNTLLQSKQSNLKNISQPAPTKRTESVKPILGSSPEHKKSYNPASQEEKARLLTVLKQPKKEVPKNILVGPSGEPMRNIQHEEPPNIRQEQPPQEIQEIFEPSPSESASPALPQMPHFRSISIRTTNFAKNIFRGGEAIEDAGVRVAGKAATSAIAKGVGSTLVKAGGKAAAGALARLGLAAGAGAATGGVGTLVVLAASALGGQMKKLGKLVLQVTIAMVCAVLLIILENWGLRLTSLLPPYAATTGYAEPLPTGTITPTPTGTITPPPINASSCPIPGGQITCGSYFTSINGCGHCDGGYLEAYRLRWCHPDFGGNATYYGTESALDIGGYDDQPFYLPTIDDQIINWNFIGESPNSSNNPLEAIIRYNGTDTRGRIYSIYFHHSQPGSSNSSAHRSGDLAGRICSRNQRGEMCDEGHVHVQIAGGSGGWMDAALLLCR